MGHRTGLAGQQELEFGHDLVERQAVAVAVAVAGAGGRIRSRVQNFYATEIRVRATASLNRPGFGGPLGQQPSDTPGHLVAGRVPRQMMSP